MKIRPNTADKGRFENFDAVVLQAIAGIFLLVMAGCSAGQTASTQRLSATEYQRIEWMLRTEVKQWTGTPHLLGGNSRSGIDCSGLVQLSLQAAGRDCPRDADMQEAALGRTLDDDAELARGDLIFWRGHVGIMTDAETLLHANAHHMAVAREPLAGAIERIAAGGDGGVTRRARVGTAYESL